MLRETVLFRFVCREFSSRNGYYDWIYASPAKLVSFHYSLAAINDLDGGCARAQNTKHSATTNETFSPSLAKWTHKILFCIRYGVYVRVARKCTNTIDSSVVSAHLRVWITKSQQKYKHINTFLFRILYKQMQFQGK